MRPVTRRIVRAEAGHVVELVPATGGEPCRVRVRERGRRLYYEASFAQLYVVLAARAASRRARRGSKL